MRPAATSPLLTDIYQLTMMQSYLEHGLTGTAVFEFFVRQLPDCRGFLMAAGLEQALDFLERFHFCDEELEWLRASGRFSTDFIDYLQGLRFDGDVHAMAEGSVFFTNEPVLRVCAALPVAQLMESRLINILHFQSLIASKAARSVLAAPGKLLVDFGLRRTHEAEAGFMAARAAYVAGFSGTSNALAAAAMEIPVYGTMAHSFVLAHDSEKEAFLHFARSQPDNVVLLIDTFDTERAAVTVVDVAAQLGAEGIAIRAVRLDSGDLGRHARRVRRILDEGGLAGTNIFVSGNLDEYELMQLRQAPIDGFGVGTRMNTSADAPYLDCAYKIQEYAGRPRRKTSEGKATMPGRKQVYRYFKAGRMDHDIITVDGDKLGGMALIEPVMQRGRRLRPSPPLAAIRTHAAAQLATLPDHLRALKTQPAYQVGFAEAVERLAEEADQQKADI